MNEPEKFTIRINFRKTKDQAPGDKSRSQYHWGRIIGVSLAVIVTIASLISAGSYYLNQDQTDSQQIKSVADKRITSPALVAPSSLKKDAVKTAEAETDALTEETAVIKPAETDTAPEENTVIKSALADTVVAEESAVITPSTADTLPEETAVIKPAETDTAPEENTVIRSALTDDLTAETAVIIPAETDTAIEENTVIKSALADTVAKESAVINPSIADTLPEETAVITPSTAETLPEETAVITPSTAETVSPVLFTQSQTKLLSANVTRFVISQAVQNNEPIGTISDIHFDDNNIATVYAYSDVNAFKDQTLYYQWSLDGKKIAKIRVYVRGDRWRSYSSKFIQPDMHGEWKVELQNQAGENLAINQFHY